MCGAAHGAHLGGFLLPVPWLGDAASCQHWDHNFTVYGMRETQNRVLTMCAKWLSEQQSSLFVYLGSFFVYRGPFPVPRRMF
jgi:hypothetical protein